MFRNYLTIKSTGQIKISLSGTFYGIFTEFLRLIQLLSYTSRRISSVSVLRYHSLIIFIYINKSIAFFHFTSRCAYQVNAAPGSVSQQVYTIFFHRCFHSFDMFSQILDPVIIFHISVFIRFSSSALYRSSIIFFALLQDHTAQP